MPALAARALIYLTVRIFYCLFHTFIENIFILPILAREQSGNSTCRLYICFIASITSQFRVYIDLRKIHSRAKNVVMCVLTQPVVLIFVFNDQLEILILVDNHYLSTQENS